MFHNTFVLLVPTAFFMAALIGAHASVMARNHSMLAWLGGLWLAFTVSMILAMATAHGWDGIPYFLVLLFVAAPTGAGLLIGSVIGFYKMRDLKDD